MLQSIRNHFVYPTTIIFRLSLGRVGAGQRKVELVNAYGKEDDGHDDADDEPTDRHLLR